MAGIEILGIWASSQIAVAAINSYTSISTPEWSKGHSGDFVSTIKLKGQMTDDELKAAAAKINLLYKDMVEHSRKVLMNASEVGEMLSGEKQWKTPDQWDEWIIGNTNFSLRVANNYIEIINRKEELSKLDPLELIETILTMIN